MLPRITYIRIFSAHFYNPFGMVMPGREYAAEEYKFGFNGKEKDVDISGDNYDFGARIYDSRLGRWLSPDFVTKYDISKYTAFLNNPLVFIDPDGNTDYFYSDGTFHKSIQDGTTQIRILGGNSFEIKVITLNARYMSTIEIEEYKKAGKSDADIESIREQRVQSALWISSTNLPYHTFDISSDEKKSETFQILKNIYLHYEADLKIDLLEIGKQTIFYNDPNKSKDRKRSYTGIITIKPNGQLPDMTRLDNSGMGVYSSSQNLVSLIKHEKYHQTKNGVGGIEEEFNAYLVQIKDPEFGKTSLNYQQGIIERAKRELKNIDIEEVGYGSDEGDEELHSEYAKTLGKTLDTAVQNIKSNSTENKK